MITFTEKAAEKARDFIESRNVLGIRFGIKSTGCSGFGYILEVADEQLDTDTVFEDKGVKIFVNKEDLIFIDGTVLDWQKQGLNEGFAFLNPNATGTCGCGESFSVDDSKEI